MEHLKYGIQYLRLWVGNIVKDTINQLRMKEQIKRYNAGVAVKQQKKYWETTICITVQRQHFYGICEAEQNSSRIDNFHHSENLRAVYLALSLALIKTNPKWFISSLVMDANRTI